MRTERFTNESSSILQMQLGDGGRLVVVIATLGRKGGTSHTWGSKASRAEEFTRAAERRGADHRSKHAHLVERLMMGENESPFLMTNNKNYG
jgi:LmbE family N-acetylglucosaminyl deacetylase